MMFNYACDDCLTVYSVNGMDKSINILPVVLECPKCRKRINVTSKWESRSEVMVMSAEALFRAANGLPLPDVESASEARVSHLLLNGKVVSAKLVPVDQDRVVIESLTIQTNAHSNTLHFATSTKGATIYKVSTP